MLLPFQGRPVSRVGNAIARESLSAAIVPQMMKECGNCTPLTWPNGTHTGACSQGCCSTEWMWTPGGGSGPQPSVAPRVASAVLTINHRCCLHGEWLFLGSTNIADRM